MKKLLIGLAAGIALLLATSTPRSQAPCTVTTADTSYAAVNNAVQAAANGDVVCVPPGTGQTWSQTVNITKYITLQGAGRTQTIVGNTATPFTFSPTSPGLNLPFRVTGFRFNQSGSNTRPFVVSNSSNSLFLTKVRIDNNHFTGTGSLTSQQGQFSGPVYGVFDHNIVDGDLTITPYHDNNYSWLNYTYAFGTQNVMVFEDNTFNRINSDWYIIESGLGGRWVVRFNTINLVRSAQPLFDAHGNGGSCCNASNMGFENYNNVITGFTGGNFYMAQRGGKGVIWGNRASTSANDVNLREEFADTDGPSAPFGPTGQPEHVSDSYFWDNQNSGGSQFSVSESQDCCGAIAPNVDYWLPQLSFNGTVGTGWGTLANRPASCTTGVGYFATDQGSWNSTGADGLLYKCGQANVWTLYYTPLAHPHPLITGAGSDTTPPTDPSSLAVNPAGSSNTVIAVTFVGSTDANPITYLGESCIGGACVNFAQVATSSTTTMNFSGMTPGTTYRLRVRATDNVNFSGYTNIVTWTTTSTGITYYIDKDLPASSDSNAGTTEALPWKTFTKANATLTAGDTVLVKTGTYTAGTANFVQPINSGISTARITYQAFPGATVTVTNGNYAVLLDGKSYVTVKGMNFTLLNRFSFMQNGANFNIIEGNTFTAGVNYDGSSWAGSRIWQNSHHNIIRSNVYKEWGVCANADDQGSVFEVGGEDVGGDASDFNLFELNVMARGGHHALGIWSRFNVVRKNYFYNDAWTAGKGNRSLALGGIAGNAGSNLIEDNRIGYSYVPCDQEGAAGMQLAGPSNIFRYNYLYHNNLAGIDITTYDADTSLNLIYHNTFFNNACPTGCAVPQPDPYGGNGRYFGAMVLDDNNAPLMVNNRIKNNLFYSHPLDQGQPIGQNGGLRSSQTIANNYDGDALGNPLFVNAGTTVPADKTDQTVPNLSLTASSPAIGFGGALTTVSSGCSGSTSSITLADATYFQDGTWGTGGTVQQDWIAVGTTTTAAQINTITGNVVTLKSAISCANGNSVWLYRNSSGVQVLYGSAPDAGAYEFPGDTTAPSIVTGVGVK